MDRTILTLEKAHERTGISVDTFRYWRRRKRGEGPVTFRLGRRVVMTEHDLTAWIDKQRAAATAEPQDAA